MKSASQISAWHIAGRHSNIAANHANDTYAKRTRELQIGKRKAHSNELPSAFGAGIFVHELIADIVVA